MSVIDDAALLKLAEAEILGETKRATIRHSTAGPSGWQPVPKPNKSFLVNTLLQTLSSNRILSKKKHRNMKNGERKLLQLDRKTSVSHNFIYKKPKPVSEPKKKIKSKSKKKKRTKHGKKKKKSKMKK